MANKHRLNYDPALPGEEYILQLTDEELIFVQNYLVKPDPCWAYRQIHPKCDRVRAARRGKEMMARPHVFQEIRTAHECAQVNKEVSTDETLQEVRAIAFSDPMDLVEPNGKARNLMQVPYELRKAIKTIKVQKATTEITNNQTKKTTKKVTYEIVEYQLWDKMKALATLCEHLGISKEIPPLDALLNLLPPAQREEFRKLLFAEVKEKTNEPVGTPVVPLARTNEPDGSTS